VKSISPYNQKPQMGGLGTSHISSLTDFDKKIACNFEC